MLSVFIVYLLYACADTVATEIGSSTFYMAGVFNGLSAQVRYVCHIK
jgi:hypothetical protein